MAKKKPTDLIFECIPCDQGSHKLCVFTGNARLLSKVFAVNERDPDNETGYQRVCSPARLKAIGQYVDRAKPLPLSILVSLKTSANLSADKKTLTIPNRKGAGWIIDGQHRLLGAARAEREIVLPVVAFLGLSEREQAEQFVTVNKEQKGVPTSLRYDLLKQMTSPKSETDQAKERATELAHALRRDAESPFADRIVILRTPGKGELSLNNFVRMVHPIVHASHRAGVLFDQSFDVQTRAILNYYEALSRVFPTPYGELGSVFFRTIGFGALMLCFPKIFQIATTKYHAFQVKDIIKIFAKVDYFDFESWKRMGTGTKAEKDAAADLLSELEDSFDKDDQAILKV